MMYKEYFAGDINYFLHIFLHNDKQYLSIKELSKALNISELPQEQLVKRFEIFVGDKIENILLPKINKNADVMNIKNLNLMESIKELKGVFSMENVRYIIENIPTINNSNDVLIINKEITSKFYEDIISRTYTDKIQIRLLINEILSKYKYYKLDSSDHLCSRGMAYINLSQPILSKIKLRNSDEFEVKNIKEKGVKSRGLIYIIPKKNNTKLITRASSEIITNTNEVSQQAIEEKAKDFIESFFLNTTEDENFIIKKILIEKMQLKKRINDLHKQYEENYVALKQLTLKSKGDVLICNN